jgi:hypothetical protein
MVERVVALAVVAAAGVYLAEALRYAPGTPARPGPGLFPVAVGVFGAVVALSWLGVALRRRAATRGPSTPTEGRGRVLAAAAALAGFCLLLPWTGYPIVAFLFVGALLRRLGAGWRGTLFIALVSAAASYYLFAVLLGVPLPRGALLG